MLTQSCMKILIALSVLVALAPPAYGQGAGRSEINGAVFDQEKAVLPGVTVTVTEENTGLTRTTVTTGDGTFLIPTLLPGTYTIKADLPGFQPTTQTGLRLSVGQELSINLTLQVGGIQESVTVTGEAPLVEVTASRVGANISNQEIDNLPSAGAQPVEPDGDGARADAQPDTWDIRRRAVQCERP